MNDRESFDDPNRAKRHPHAENDDDAADLAALERYYLTQQAATAAAPDSLEGDPAGLAALEHYYLRQEARITRELRDLEDRFSRRVRALEDLEIRLSQRLDALHALETKLKEELESLESADRPPNRVTTEA